VAHTHKVFIFIGSRGIFIVQAEIVTQLWTYFAAARPVFAGERFCLSSSWLNIRVADH